MLVLAVFFKFFFKFGNLLHSGPKVADRRATGARLLDHVHIEDIAKVPKQLAGRSVALAF